MCVVSRWVLAVAFAGLACVPWCRGQDRETKVRQDVERFSQDSRWIYNDLDKGRRLARETNRPLLVVFRCVPCEACSEFDHRVAERENEISDLLDKYVCVRIIHTNGLDLSLFQIDFDQSFHAVIMNADNVIYGRFGTRSRRPEAEDMTMIGFRRALERGLEWHEGYPANRDWFAGKRQPEASVPVPEAYPSLRQRFTSKLDFTGKIVPSCIHCHQVREAERLIYRSEDRPIPLKQLFPFPLPDVLGLRMDPEQCATITQVEPQSIAAKAGLVPGDRIERLGGQPLLSIADLQWVLHTAADPAKLPAVVRRGSDTREITLELPEGWRRTCDISWRVTTWDLRRMATGGMLLEELSDDEREELGLPANSLALRAKHVGQFGEHAVAKRAGFQKGDIIVELDGRREPLRETDWIAYALEKPRGSKLTTKVLRGQREVTLSFATQ